MNQGDLESAALRREMARTAEPAKTATDGRPDGAAPKSKAKTNGRPEPERPGTEAQAKPDAGKVASKAAASHISQATALIRLVSAGVEYFHDSAGRAYATFGRGDHIETHSLSSRGFRLFLQQRYYAAKKAAISGKSVLEALGVLEARALFDGTEREVCLRVGEVNGALYLDLGNANWESVEITGKGWRILPEAPVRFRRAKGMLPIPHPVREPEAISHIRELFNVKPEGSDLELLIACVLAALRPRGPYPVLVLNAEQGTAKSTTARVIRSLVDPNQAPLRTLPREDRDLAIAANNSHVIALDNVSHLPEWLSDAICRLSTGGGFGTRELYSDDEEALFSAQRPVVLNGIEEIAIRGDLTDRSVVLELPVIPEQQRLTEAQFWQRFDRWGPGILGYLLNAAAGALANIGTVKLTRLPRMADFASWIVAAEGALGWEPGFFMSIYGRNLDEANAITLEASAIGRHLVTLRSWEGTASELLNRLNIATPESERKQKSWPASPRGLSNALRRLLPSLRRAGIMVTFDRAGKDRERRITVEKVDSSA